jgi:OOP family OmpA-OmpF porin
MTRHAAFSPRLLALLLAGSAAPVFAQEYNPSWYLLPSINTMWPDSKWDVDGNRVGGGLRFGKPVSQSFDVQLGADYAWTGQEGRKYRQTIFGGDVLWMLSRKQWRPFLSVGAGGERDQLNNPAVLPGSKGDTSPYVSGGLGMQAFFNERWFAQADAKYVYGFLKKDNWNGQDSSGNWRFNLGIGLMFSVPPKPAPVVAPPPPAPTPEPAAPPPPPPPKFEKVTLEAAKTFEFNSAKLGPETPKLDEVVSTLQAQPEMPNIKVTGYTDRIGSDKYNMKLSQDRADAVKARLVEKGIPADKIEAVGMGKANPIVPCEGIKKRKALIECLAPNRRVELEPITIERKVE